MEDDAPEGEDTQVRGSKRGGEVAFADAEEGKLLQLWGNRPTSAVVPFPLRQRNAAHLALGQANRSQTPGPCKQRVAVTAGTGSGGSGRAPASAPDLGLGRQLEAPRRGFDALGCR